MEAKDLMKVAAAGAVTIAQHPKIQEGMAGIRHRASSFSTKKSSIIAQKPTSTSTSSSAATATGKGSQGVGGGSSGAKVVVDGILSIRHNSSVNDLVRSTSRVLTDSFAGLRKHSSALQTYVSDSLVIRNVDNCAHCQQFPVCQQHGSYSLIAYKDTPEFMKGNPYVTSGYRPAEVSALMCFKSLFKLHNESVNIWSHIIGFLLFSYFLVVDNLETLPSVNAVLMDHIVLSIGTLCFMICMLMSACFHLFWCISESTHNRWLTLDLLGVTFALIGCYITGIHYAFYCYEAWHNLYMSLLTTIAVCTFLAPLHPEYASTKFYWHRLTLYILIGLYGLIPTAHWCLKNGGFSTEFTMKFLPSILMIYGLCGLGVCFYILMIPERWLPGWFDFIGWSHQWWHLLILAGLIMWRNAGIDIVEYRRSTSCLADELTFVQNITSFLTRSIQ